MSETPNQPETPESADYGTESHAGESFVGERITGRKMDGADLTDADFTRAQLKRSSFTGANLTDASLCGAQLTHVNLSRANLKGADLRGAQLSNVNLSEADLTGADLLGAVLKGVNLDKATLVETRLTGANLETVSLTETDLTRADLDGAASESNTFKQARLEGTRLRGSRFGRCTLEDCDLVDCDLSGATLDTSLLKNCSWTGCDLYGVLLRKVRFRGLEVQSCNATHSYFEDCTGLPVDAEMELGESGALLRPNVGAKVWRLMRENRKLQLGLLIGVAIFLAIAVLVASQPNLWPTWALVSRMENLSNDAETADWCEDYVGYGEILAERSMENVARHNQLLFVAAHCYGDNERHDDAERVFRRCIELASGSTRDQHAARLQLANYYLATSRLDEAEAIAREIADDPRADAWTRLNGLRQVESILSQRGGSGTAATEWVALQVRIAEEILANDYETHTAGMLMETPAELYVWGEWELADRLLAWAVPPLSDEDCWSQVSKAMVSCDSLGREKEAVALCDHLLKSERFAEGLYRALLVHEAVTLMAREEGQDEIEALFERLAPTADDELDLVESILTIRQLLAEEEATKAFASASALPTDDLAFPLLELTVWVQVDAALDAEKETEAIESLRPLMAAIEDQDSIDRATAELLTLSSRLSRPDLLSDLIESVGNPALGEFNVLREIMLTTLQQEADDGTLAVDDPRLAKLLDSPDEWVAERGVQMMMRAAETSGVESEAIELLTQRARKASGTSQLNIALVIMDGQVSRGAAADAIALAAELKLEESATEDYRARLYAILVRASLGEGDDAAAEAWLVRATESEPPLPPDQQAEIIRQMVQHHSDHGNTTQALDLIRRHETKLDLSDHEEPVLNEYLFLLYSTGQDAAANAHLASIASTTPACALEFIRIASLTRAEKPISGVEALVDTCAAADVGDNLKLEVATYLQGAHTDVDFLKLLKGMSKERMSVWDRMTVSTLEARATFDGGEPDAAVTLLETEYAQLVDGEARGAITAMLLSFHEELEDAVELQRVYARFAADHTAVLNQDLWQQACRALIALDEEDRIDTLASKPEWGASMQLTLAKLELGKLVQERDFAAAWSFLDSQRKTVEDPKDLEQLVWWAREVRDGSGDAKRSAAFLETLVGELTAGSPTYNLVQLERADALGSVGDHAGALALLTPLMETQLSSDDRENVVRLYARALGYTSDDAKVAEAGLRKLEGAGIASASAQEARLETASGLVERNQYDAARQIITPLAGTPLAQSAGSAYYHVIVRAWTEDSLYDEAAGLSSRFPPGPSLSACQADLIVIGSLPSDADAFKRLHARILADCEFASLSPHEFMGLLDSTSQDEPEQALSLLERYRAARKLNPGEAHSLAVGEAQLLAMTGKHADSRKLLRKVITEATDTWVVTSALGMLLQGANVDGAKLPEADIEAAVAEALAKVEPGGDESIQMQRDLVQYLIGSGKGGEALKQQRKLVESLTGTGPVEAEELLQLAKLELTANGHRSSAWRRHVATALEMSAGDEHLNLRIESLRTAAKVAGSSPSRATAIVAEASSALSESQRNDFAIWVADDLVGVLEDEERAQVLREAADPEPQ